jgi:hemerythrin-like metal-binding protein
MDVIKWDDSYSVNVEEIDLQHKELVRMLNHLAVAIKKKKGSDVLARTLEGLITYAEQHFKTEEKYFTQFGYPEEESHREEHLTFSLKVLDYKEKLKTDELGLSMEILDFMWDWLKHHIKGTDSKYSQFFNDNGLH